jgi:phage terminase small subunit
MELESGSLSPRQRRFVAEYLKEPNATRAAKMAGYSRKTAYSQGQRLLKNVEIRRAVEADLAAAGISAHQVLQELWRVAKADMGDAFNPDGSMRTIPEMPEDFRRALTSINGGCRFTGFGQDHQQVGMKFSLRLTDKVHALELLGKYLGLFSAKDGANDSQDLWEQLEQFRERREMHPLAIPGESSAPGNSS